METNILEALHMTKEFAFIYAGLFGMVCHYLKKLFRGEVSGNFLDYFLRDYPGHSMGALFAYGLAAATLLATGTLNAMEPWAALGCGFVTGWFSDSAMNKGD